MRKHLQNLERVCQKLQFRYGDTDELVMELKKELESLNARKSAHPAGTQPHGGHQDPAKASAQQH